MVVGGGGSQQLLSLIPTTVMVVLLLGLWLLLGCDKSLYQIIESPGFDEFGPAQPQLVFVFFETFRGYCVI